MQQSPLENNRISRGLPFFSGAELLALSLHPFFSAPSLRSGADGGVASFGPVSLHCFEPPQSGWVASSHTSLLLRQAL